MGFERRRSLVAKGPGEGSLFWLRGLSVPSHGNQMNTQHKIVNRGFSLKVQSQDTVCVTGYEPQIQSRPSGHLSCLYYVSWDVSE